MAKFCGNCGNRLNEEDKKCGNCGATIVEEKNTAKVSTPSSSNNTSTTKTNAFAIAGFTVSMISWLCCGLPAIVGLILSIIGLVECNKKEEEGKGLAIAGIIISAIITLVVGLCFFIGLFTGFYDSLSTY